MDNWLLIVVGVVFLISIAVGYYKGFLKIGLSLLSSILTIILVIYLSPHIAKALVDFTPADEMIADACIEAFVPEVSADILAEKDLSGTPFEGLDAEKLDHLSDLDFEQYGITAQDILNVVGEFPKDQQIREIENSTLPKFLKELLLENNNTMIYEELGVDTFAEYVAGYVARMVINIVAFLLTFLLAIIIVKALMTAIDIIGELPVLGFFNHLGGGIVGAFVALLLVWLGFLVVTLIYTTEVGKATFAMIEQSWLLTFLYEKNILLSKLIGF